eukprot:Skav208105  [mRNA]  locus=scaffold1681:280237:282314:- [translate_table: standard]
MSKRKAPEAAPISVSISVRWALSGEILSVLCISPEAGQVLFQEKTLLPQSRLGAVDGLLEYAEVAVVKRPPLLAMLSCDGLFGLWKPEMGEQRSHVSGPGPAGPTIGTSGFPVAAGALALSPSSDASHL